MVQVFWAAFVALESAAALAVGLHALAWLHLLLTRQRPRALPEPLQGDDLPLLTVQLPLYNERDQVEGLLRAAAALDWPADRLEIQVLDDSTDGTPMEVERVIAALEVPWIVHLRRSSRAGFKAGALAHGLKVATGSLIAIFDADFRPRPDFLRRAAAALAPDIGLVQARWSWRNPATSIRTRAQALHLDAHFTLEQQARSSTGLLMGFNGTAGLWRRAAIEAAGGWEADTLTEDLDLAYRSQLAGWRLAYVDDLSVDSELPDDIAAIRTQQHRWIRGGAQVARKLLRALWRSPQPLRRKLQGTAHLLSSSVFMPVLVLCLLLPGQSLVAQHGPAWMAPSLILPGLVLRGVLVVLLLCFGAVCIRREGGVGFGIWRLTRDFPAYLGLATAIAPFCARAAWMGWTAPTGIFERTPKGREPAVRTAWPESLPAEILLATWTWLGAILAITSGQSALGLFLALQGGAFTALVGMTLRPMGRILPAPQR